MFYRVTMIKSSREGLVFDSGYEYESKEEMFEDLKDVIFDNITIYESEDGHHWQEASLDKILLTDEERTRCEIWTRVMGYHRPVESFNKGKKSEFYSRKCFTEAKATKQR